MLKTMSSGEGREGKAEEEGKWMMEDHGEWRMRGRNKEGE